MSGPVDPKDVQGEVTSILLEVARGDAGAIDRLVEVSYSELRRLAHLQLGRSRPGDTLNTTGLVHEVYVKLVDASRVRAGDRRHFFALMARTMRQVLVDYARERSAQKRGGGAVHVRLDEVRVGAAEELDGVLAIDRALERLADVDERMVRVVECRFFSGYTEEETAEVLDIPLRTVQRTWKRARAWLRQDLSTA